MTRLGSHQDPALEGRVGRVAAVVVVVFAVFLARLFQLQVIEGDRLAASSQRNSIRTLLLAAPRGEIVDRDGRVLATTRPARHLQVVASELGRPDRTFALLGDLLGANSGELAAVVAARRGRERFQPFRLVEDLPYNHLAAVESLSFALRGVFTEATPRRHYPHGRVAAHLLGTLGEIQPAQLDQRRFADYRPGDEIGQSGIEALLETFLHGRAGGKNVVVDVAGREVEVLDEVKPLPGGRVELTLDLDLQLAAEQGFAPDPEAPLPELRTGAVVALDPRNGDVLALVSAPAFDPTEFADGIDANLWRALQDDPEKPLQNRAVAGQYPPGSTYKAIVAAAALDAGFLNPMHETFCPGSFRLGRRRYRCWKRGGHGPVDLHHALMESCDVYFYRAGLELGIDRLAGYARGFGLGRPTGIALDGEASGLVPTRQWKERRFQEPWVEGETVSASIGQGFNLVTPMQLATAYAALANGGKVFRPRLVRARVTRDGRLHPGDAVEMTGEVAIDPRHLERVRAGLVAVVMDPKGTGKRARVPGLVVAGKTGTAQVVRLEHVEGLEEDEIPRRYRDHALFAAFAPAGAPEIVVVVVLEHGGGGGANAAPIAQRVLARWFEKHGPPPLPDDAVVETAEASRGAD